MRDYKSSLGFFIKLLKNENNRPFISMFLICMIGSFLIVANYIFNLPMPWLYVNPSYMNIQQFNWISGTWASVLGIHGTIAALSITFMGMFISQVSLSSPKYFEPICRVLILRENKLLQFSLEAICGLLSGIYLLVIGGGLIQYLLSISISIFFIISYMRIYIRLYTLTEKQSIINELLSTEIKKVGENKSLLTKEMMQLDNEFKNSISKSKNLTSKYDANYFENNIVRLNIKNDITPLSPIGFFPDKIKNLDDIIGKTSSTVKTKLYLDINFTNPHTPFVAELSFIGVKDAVECNTDIIKIAINRIAKFGEVGDEQLAYAEHETAIVNNAFDILINHDTQALDFCINSIVLLSANENLVLILYNLVEKLTSSLNRNKISPVLLSSFYMKLYFSLREKTQENRLIEFYKIMLSCPFSLYYKNKSDYYEYSLNINDFLESRIRNDNINNDFLSAYTLQTIKNLSHMRYDTFELNTDFLTKKIQYMYIRDDLIDKTKKNDILTRVTRECIALLIVRLDFLFNSSRNSDAEINNLKKLLLKWLESKFIDDSFYNQGIYNSLFKVQDGLTNFDSFEILQELPEDEVRTSFNTLAFKEAICLILFNSISFRCRLNLMYIRDVATLYKESQVTTFMLQSMIEYTSSEQFIKIIRLLESSKDEGRTIENIDESINSRIGNLKSSLGKLLADLSRIITIEIEISSLNENLVKNYTDDMNRNIIENLEQIIDIKSFPSKNINSAPIYKALIEKREVIDSLDGVHYSKNDRNHSVSVIYNWLRHVFNLVKTNELNISEIESFDEISSINPMRSVTLFYIDSKELNMFRYRKGFVLNDSKGYMSFKSPGYYYLDIGAEFDLEINQNKVTSSSIVTIDDDNMHDIESTFELKEINPLLKSILSSHINIEIKPHKIIKLKYLSKEKHDEFALREDELLKQLTSLPSVKNTDSI